jgi:hypothetical protein
MTIYFHSFFCWYFLFLAYHDILAYMQNLVMNYGGYAVPEVYILLDSYCVTSRVGRWIKKLN